MASDIGTVIDKLEIAQIDKGETLYVNDEGEFRTAKKGFWSWLSMRSSGFNNDAALVAQRITALVSSIGDLAPHYQRLKPALDNFRTRILKAKKQPVREDREKALARALALLRGFDQVPQQPSSPVSVPGRGRRGSPVNRGSDSSPEVGSVHSIATTRSGTPDSARSSSERVGFAQWVDEAVQRCAGSYLFDVNSKDRLGIRVAGNFRPNEVISQQAVDEVASREARTLATEEHLALWEQSLKGQIERDYGAIEIPAARVRELARTSTTGIDFAQAVHVEAARIAARGLNANWNLFCEGAGITADGMPFTPEKREFNRIVALEEAVQKWIDCNYPHSYLTNDRSLMKDFLARHFSQGSRLMFNELVGFLTSKGFKSEDGPILKNGLAQYFPDDVFEVSHGLLTRETRYGFSSYDYHPRLQEANLVIRTKDQDASTKRSDADLTALIEESYLPLPQAAGPGIFISQSLRTHLAGRLRNQMYRMQNERIQHPQRPMIYPTARNEEQFRRAWVSVLVERATERMFAKELPAAVQTQLVEVILHHGKGKPIQELGQIARREIDKLK